MKNADEPEGPPALASRKAIEEQADIYDRGFRPATPRRRHDEWGDEELQMLYDVVNDPCWFAKVAPFLDRTENTIRNRMSQLRKEAHINIRAAPYGLERQNK